MPIKKDLTALDVIRWVGDCGELLPADLVIQKWHTDMSYYLELCESLAEALQVEYRTLVRVPNKRSDLNLAWRLVALMRGIRSCAVGEFEPEELARHLPRAATIRGMRGNYNLIPIEVLKAATATYNGVSTNTIALKRLYALIAAVIALLLNTHRAKGYVDSPQMPELDTVRANSIGARQVGICEYGVVFAGTKKALSIIEQLTGLTFTRRFSLVGKSIEQREEIHRACAKAYLDHPLAVVTTVSMAGLSSTGHRFDPNNPVLGHCSPVEMYAGSFANTDQWREMRGTGSARHSEKK